MKLQILIFACFILLPGYGWADKNQDFFNVYDLDLDGKLNLYHIDDLNNDQKNDIIMVHEIEDKKRMVSIFFQHNDGFHENADQTWVFDERAILFDTGNINEDSNKEIVCILKDGVYYYQLEDNKYDLSLHKLLATDSIFVVPNKDIITDWDFVRDLNDDHIDDLFIPFFDGYGIFYKNQSYGYEFSSKITAPVTSEITTPRKDEGIGESASAQYLTATFLFKDYNQDSRSDIIAFNENNLFIFYQDEKGRFSNETGRHEIVSIIENKKYLSISIGAKNEKEQVAIRKITDLNSDGFLDIIAQKMSTSTSLLNPTSQLQIYLGKKSDTNRGARFEKTPDQIIVCEGLQLGAEIKDLTGDNNMDFIVPSIKLGVLKIVKMLLMSRATFEILIYNANASGLYPDIPDFKTDLSIEFSFSGGSTIPVNNFNDYNGDGRTDLLTSKSNEELNIYFGEGDNLFVKKKPDVSFRIALPKDGNLVKATSLNADDKMDLIIKYIDYEKEKESEKSLLKILIAG